jgi:hypothetical protein
LTPAAERIDQAVVPPMNIVMVVFTALRLQFSLAILKTEVAFFAFRNFARVVPPKGQAEIESGDLFAR